MLTNRELIEGKSYLVSSLNIIKDYILDIENKCNFSPYAGVHNRDISPRQFVTTNLCLDYLINDNPLDAWREFYDCINNYNDCNLEISKNELAIYNLLITVFKYVLFKED